MFKDTKCTCTSIVPLIKPFVWRLLFAVAVAVAVKVYSWFIEGSSYESR